VYQLRNPLFSNSLAISDIHAPGSYYYRSSKAALNAVISEIVGWPVMATFAVFQGVLILLSALSVYAIMISRGGKKILDENGIFHRYEESVSNILNRSKTDICPFEKLVSNIEDSSQAFERLMTFVHDV